VWLLFDSEDNITWNHVWNLLSFSLKYNCISISHAFFNMDVQLLILIDDFFAFAVWTIAICDLTFPTTPIASNLHLHLHPNAHLNLLHYHTLAIAFRTLFLLAIFRACASALRTVNIPID